jgi:hypothetical protein
MSSLRVFRFAVAIKARYFGTTPWEMQVIGNRPDLTRDSFESRDLAKDHPGIVHRIQKMHTFLSG